MNRNSKILISIIGIIIIVIIGYWAFTPDSSPSWTGFGAYQEETDATRSKTLWDWLDLLVVPIFLSIGAAILSSIQKQSDKITETDRQRQAILISFFEQISKLLLERELRKSSKGSESRVIGRTYSLSTFRNLDGYRKAEALQFLQEAKLISHNPIISLLGANLKETYLDNATLVNSEIKGAYFNGSSFKEANLSNSNFLGSNFTSANFEGVILKGTDLSYTNLSNSILRNLDLTNTNIEWAILDNADLTNAKIKRKQLETLESSKNVKLPTDLLD